METQVLRFITAGSVDDGKSTLIGRDDRPVARPAVQQAQPGKR